MLVATIPLAARSVFWIGVFFPSHGPRFKSLVRHGCFPVICPTWGNTTPPTARPLRRGSYFRRSPRPWQTTANVSPLYIKKYHYKCIYVKRFVLNVTGIYTGYMLNILLYSRPSFIAVSRFQTLPR